MDLMFYMSGTTPYGDFGAGLAALDFNGDGYDDLAVLQRGWAPDSLVTYPPTVRYGRILIYYGGLGFDSVPDFIIEGSYNYQFVLTGGDANLAALGDINGDGYDDLGVKGNTDFGNGTIGVPLSQSIMGERIPLMSRVTTIPFRHSSLEGLRR